MWWRNFKHEMIDGQSLTFHNIERGPQRRLRIVHGANQLGRPAAIRHLLGSGHEIQNTLARRLDCRNSRLAGRTELIRDLMHRLQNWRRFLAQLLAA